MSDIAGALEAPLSRGKSLSSSSPKLELIMQTCEVAHAHLVLSGKRRVAFSKAAVADEISGMRADHVA